MSGSRASGAVRRRLTGLISVATLAGTLPVAGALPASASARAAAGLAANGPVNAAASAVRADGPTDGEPSGEVVTVTGSGFGHGVGMSQYGARGMARGGAPVRKILTHYYTGTTVAPHADDVDLRVNVVDRGTSVSLRTRALASGGGGLQLVTGGGQVIRVARDGVVGVTPDGRSLRVRIEQPGATPRTFTTGALTVRWSGGRGLPGPASVLDVRSRSANADSSWSKSRSYRWGVLRLTTVGRTDSDKVVRTRIAAVAVVNLHREYLRGVAEMPSGWPAAALQAQAVVARNYAFTEYRAGTSAVCGGCHLWDDTRSQVYRGWAHESVAPRWLTAVAATQTSRTGGLMVLYRGVPVRAYYSSSSGGRTRDSEKVWGRAVPYLRSVADPWSTDPSVNPSFARWERTVDRAKAASAFGLPDVETIEVTERDRSGAALVVTATAADGSRRSLPGGTVRSRFGLPAPWFASFE